MSNLLPVILITGANQGLGWHACQQLAKTGAYRVLLGSRDPQKGASAVQQILSTNNASIPAGVLETIPIDITSDASIDAAVAHISSTYGRLDVLVNNAGTARAASASTPLRAQYEEVFNLNGFSHAVVTEKMLPLLKASMSPTKRVVFTGSSVGSMGLGQQEGHPYFANNLPIYRSNKSAVNMLMVYYGNVLKPEGIAVTSVCPGFCATAFNGYRGTDSPENGAAAIVKAATEGSNAEVAGTWANTEGSLPY